MEYPKIAIVVPTYNEERYIETCINSLLSQTYKGTTEIIIADGFSTDRTREIINKLIKQHSNIKMKFKNG